MTCIFDEIGGSAAVAAAVERFYQLVWADPLLAGYFAGVDRQRLTAHQEAFISTALGSSIPYLGPSMRAAHQGRRITGAAFDLVVSHLATALANVGVPTETVTTIAGRLAPLKADIVDAKLDRVG